MYKFNWILCDIINFNSTKFSTNSHNVLTYRFVGDIFTLSLTIQATLLNTVNVKEECTHMLDARGGLFCYIK
jgi:hypothetical protein